MRVIVLASASPRRKELLERIGLKFKVDPSGVDEFTEPGLSLSEAARTMSLKKAHSVAERHTNAVVIAADTLVACEGKMLGKPRDDSEARAMLNTLSGRSHSVITGYSIIDTANGRSTSRSVETKVFLRPLTTEEIDAYVATGEPLDKAGGYAIQGLGAVIVERIEGDYFNVVGLPLCALLQSLKEFGVRVL